MDFLEDVAERSAVGEATRVALSSEAVHGVGLRLDTWWAWAAANAWYWRDDELRSAIERATWFAGWPRTDPRLWMPAEPSHVPGSPPDLAWHPPWWDDVVSALNPRWTQYVLTVAVRPDRAADVRDLAPAMADLGLEDIRVQFEARPLPDLYASTGAAHQRIACDHREGTSGGILRLVDGSLRLAASAHVCPETRPVVIGERAGVSAWAEKLKVIDSLPNEGDFDDAPMSDLAMIEMPEVALSRAVGARGLARHTPRGLLGQYEPLQMLTPRHARVLETDELTLVQSFRVDGLDLGGTWALYKRLFSLRIRRERWTDRTFDVGGSVGGDSGAWLVREGANGPEWAGSVVGGRPPFTYAAFAHRSIDAAGGAQIPTPDELVPDVA